MSSGKKWSIAIIVVIVIILAFWVGRKSVMLTPASTATQSAAAVMGFNSANSAANNAMIAQDVATLDTQIQLGGTDLTALTQVLSPLTVSTSAAQFQTIAGLMSKLAVKLQMRIANTSNASVKASLTASLNDMTRNVTNATSQAAVAVLNTKAPKKPTTTVLTQSQVQLQTAQSDLVAARVDVSTIVSGLSQ